MSDEPPVPEIRYEVSAGCVLVAEKKALLIRVRSNVFELPKGHVEAGESILEAALRELREETGLHSQELLTQPLSVLEYQFRASDVLIQKRVHYFKASPVTGTPQFHARPSRTRELRWVTLSELPNIPLHTEELRNVIELALGEAFSGP